MHRDGKAQVIEYNQTTVIVDVQVNEPEAVDDRDKVQKQEDDENQRSGI